MTGNGRNLADDEDPSLRRLIRDALMLPAENEPEPDIAASLDDIKARVIQADVVRALGLAGPMTSVGLARATGHPLPAVQDALDVLGKAALVTHQWKTERPPRRRLYALTDTGTQLATTLP